MSIASWILKTLLSGKDVQHASGVYVTRNGAGWDVWTGATLIYCKTAEYAAKIAANAAQAR